VSAHITRRAALGLGAGAAAALAGCGGPGGAPAAQSGSTAAPPTPSTPPAPPATTTPRRPTRTAPPPAGPAIELVNGPRTRPEVALTFHGAGDPALARQVLATLAGARARVTVLAVGTWLQANPELARAIVGAGHELGNHTWTHPALAALGPAAISAEIDRCRDLIERLTGSPGAHFRQSQGQHSTPLIRALAGRAGYRTCLSYDVDSLDWQDPPADRITPTVMASVRPGSIVSMHLGHAGTVAAIAPLLDALAGRGLRPVTVTQLLR